MPVVLLVTGLIVMFVAISYLNSYNNKEESSTETKDLALSEHNGKSCSHCGTGGCQHKIF